MFKKKSTHDLKKLKKIFLSEDSYKTLEEELNMDEKIKNYKWIYDDIDIVLSKSTEDNIEQSLVKIDKLLTLKIKILQATKKTQLQTIKSLEYAFKKKKINKQDKQASEKYENLKNYLNEIDQLLTNSLDQKESYMKLAANFLVLGYISSEDLKGRDTTGLDPKKINFEVNLKDIQERFKNT